MVYDISVLLLIFLSLIMFLFYRTIYNHLNFLLIPKIWRSFFSSVSFHGPQEHCKILWCHLSSMSVLWPHPNIYSPWDTPQFTKFRFVLDLLFCFTLSILVIIPGLVGRAFFIWEAPERSVDSWKLWVSWKYTLTIVIHSNSLFVKR